jgi:hypothetical protein
MAGFPRITSSEGYGGGGMLLLLRESFLTVRVLAPRLANLCVPALQKKIRKHEWSSENQQGPESGGIALLSLHKHQ